MRERNLNHDLDRYHCITENQNKMLSVEKQQLGHYCIFGITMSSRWICVSEKKKNPFFFFPFKIWKMNLICKRQKIKIQVNDAHLHLFGLGATLVAELHQGHHHCQTQTSDQDVEDTCYITERQSAGLLLDFTHTQTHTHMRPHAHTHIQTHTSTYGPKERAPPRRKVGLVSFPIRYESKILV